MTLEEGDFEFSLRDGVAIITPKTSDFDGSPAQRSFMKKALDTAIGAGVKLVIIDFSYIKLVTSAGSGYYIYIWKFLKDKGLGLVFVNLSPVLRDFFRITELDKLFKILQSVEDAIEYAQEVK